MQVPDIHATLELNGNVKTVAAKTVGFQNCRPNNFNKSTDFTLLLVTILVRHP